MAGGEEGGGARELDQTPTWAVSAVVFAIILISIILEKVLHWIGEVPCSFFHFLLHSYS